MTTHDSQSNSRSSTMALFSPTSPLCREGSQGYLTVILPYTSSTNQTSSLCIAPSPMSIIQNMFDDQLYSLFGLNLGFSIIVGDNVTIFPIFPLFLLSYLILSHNLIINRSYLLDILSFDLICDKNYLILSEHADTTCPTCVYHVFFTIYSLPFL
jgi:hypothetical protein